MIEEPIFCQCEFPKIPPNATIDIWCAHCDKPLGLLPVPPKPEVKPRYKIDRNGPCHCGSGRKYKKCHMPQDLKFHNVWISFRQAKRDLELLLSLDDKTREQNHPGELARVSKYVADTQPWITKYESARKDVQ